MKLCECGKCGLPAPIAKVTSRIHGTVKGQPERFIKGHGGSRHFSLGNRFGVKHGMAHSPEYDAYTQAKKRCTNQRNRDSAQLRRERRPFSFHVVR